MLAQELFPFRSGFLLRSRLFASLLTANLYTQFGMPSLQLLNSQFVENQFQSRIKGISIKHLHLDELRLVQIPVPPLDIQRQIVNQIEQEQKLVDANKRLIEIFEQKIKDKISEVWGEELHKEQGQNASSNGITKQPKPVQQVEALQGELRLSTG